MSKIIKNGQIVDDGWHVLKLAEGQEPASVALPEVPSLLPITVWLERRTEILALGNLVGVWLDSSEGPEALARHRR